MLAVIGISYAMLGKQAHWAMHSAFQRTRTAALTGLLSPTSGDPLARLFNMAARCFAYVLMNLKMPHYNMFTTQQFVSCLTAKTPFVEAALESGCAGGAVISQSDVKDMYAEISHHEIELCVWQTVEQWLSGRKNPVFNVNKSGRRGVSPGYHSEKWHLAD